MKHKRFFIAGLVAVTAFLVSLLFVNLLASAATNTAPARAREPAPARATQAISITFPPGDWPWYAQEEITVRPEPPLPSHPVELCAEVVNHDPITVHTATLEFRVANFGIGVPFTPVGAVDVEVPPGGAAQGCAVWVPPGPGHWCIEVLLHQLGAQEPERSQRNIDIWEPLKPGEPHTLHFPVGPLPQGGLVTLTHHNLLPGWDVAIDPMEIDLQPGTERIVSLTTFVPPDAVLGTFEPIVDVEGYLNGESIGGFRKMDTPPVVLHHRKEPFFAESEIHVWPYPPLDGEPTQICAEVYNLSDVPQSVEIMFSVANFGIGLPFTPINGPIAREVPPHSHEMVCINWIPPQAGHFCVQVEMHILGDVPYHPQFSQRNLDVDEPLEPGVPHVTQFPVGNFPQFTNPDPVQTDIWLAVDRLLPGWEVVLDPEVLPGVPPEDIRWVTMTVTPPPDGLPPDNTPILDVQAMVDSPQGPHVIGGFRKVFRPPIPLHPFPDPPYAEREIKVHPYPPLAGEPTEICVELRNPTPYPQDVQVQFSWANFGVGLPFTPINGLRNVHLPPHSVVHECIHWVPPVSGHLCLQVELFIPGYEPQHSQRNIDVDEPLMPGEPDVLTFPVGNPFDQPRTLILGLVPHLPGWGFELSHHELPDMEPGATEMVSLTVLPPPGQPIPEDDTPIVDVEVFADDELIGGFRKIHRPPIPLHPFPDPPYAEREITVEPYPPHAGEPTEICVELRNPTPWPQDVQVQFSWANFGIGLPFQPINGLLPVHLPPFSKVKRCIHWVPPHDGHICLQVALFMDDHPPQRSQRNIDVNEPLRPNEPHARRFPVGNPFDRPMTITLGLVPHFPDWGLRLSQDVLPNMQPGEQRAVTLTVTPPDDLPRDGDPIVDVEAYGEGRLIGGFRKIFRPPVPIHRPRDPFYAESEIFIHPYPPREREPTEVGVEIRNPTDEPQTVTITFSAANFGIGLPFHSIHPHLVVEVPPRGMLRPHVMWVPPRGGLWCIQVEIAIHGHDEVLWSRLNLDVGEPLEPLVPHPRPFPVRNPTAENVTITLGLIPHFPDWGLALSQDVLPDMAPGEVREVILTVTPPRDLPADGDPIVDVEAFIEGELLGGFRKIFRPPVPVHRPKDPIYAESEIGVDPYPVVPGQPVELSVEVFNPTAQDRIVTATFSIAHFGIGLPFTTTHIHPNPINILVPAHGAARGYVIWGPPQWRGKFCVQVTLEMAGHEPIWSRRNIDVGEPLEPNIPHPLVFPVGVWPHTEPVTISLGLIKHRDMWDIQLSDDMLVNVQPGQIVPVTLTTKPPQGARLGTGDPIVDVEAFVEGELLGGFRKVDRPPIPLHKPHEKGYAESEISIDPYPLAQGQDSIVSTVVQNTSEETMTVDLAFGWAKFGIGIPFTSTGMTPPTRTVELTPEMTSTVSVTWTPAMTGHQCVQIILSDPDGTYDPQRSQRNVDVSERPPCGQTREFSFTVYNDSPFTATVQIGLITFNVPNDWHVTTEPTDTLTIGPFGEGVVKVLVEIPCMVRQQSLARQAVARLQQASGSVPTIDVEGYVSGTLVGGIEIQFGAAAPEQAGIDLSPGDSQTAQPGTVVTYTHVVTNTGTTTDTVTLDVASSEDWNVSLLGGIYPGETLKLPLRLGSGLSATVVVSLSVPTDAISGTVDTTTITATSGISPTLSIIVNDVTTVVGGQRYIYLPLVLRNA